MSADRRPSSFDFAQDKSAAKATKEKENRRKKQKKITNHR
jgi:hypothetical protein